MSTMKDVANILNVEIGEEFRATGIKEDFRITDSRFERLTICKEWAEAPADILYKLLKGEWEVVKKPWKPKLNEDYFICANDGKPCRLTWQGGVLGLSYYAVGNCFETIEEAKAYSEEVLARLNRIYDDGTPLVEQVGTLKQGE